MVAGKPLQERKRLASRKSGGSREAVAGAERQASGPDVDAGPDGPGGGWGCGPWGWRLARRQYRRSRPLAIRYLTGGRAAASQPMARHRAERTVRLLKPPQSGLPGNHDCHRSLAAPTAGTIRSSKVPLLPGKCNVTRGTCKPLTPKTAPQGRLHLTSFGAPLRRSSSAVQWLAAGRFSWF